ncbi:MAG: D-alanyl-D-alanine carboxypeptidase family protein [Chloroflexota bacterium]
MVRASQPVRTKEGSSRRYPTGAGAAWWLAALALAVGSLGCAVSFPPLAGVPRDGSPAPATEESATIPGPIRAAADAPDQPAPGVPRSAVTNPDVEVPNQGPASGVGGGPPPPSAPTSVALAADPPEPAVLRSAPTSPRDEANPNIPGVSADAYLVMDAADGRVLLERGGDAHRSPASLTKVMTLLLALERGEPTAPVTVGDEVLNLRFSTLMGLQPGEQLSLLDVCYGMMYPSGNDAAMAIGAHIAGSVGAFVALMNQRARQLGMWNTSYANPHGLDSRNGDHYTTARDLAALTRFAMQRADFRKIVAGRGWTARGLRGAYPLFNGNTFLSGYPGANGVKVGYTRRAGHTIIATATRDGRQLIAVALGTLQRDTESRRLLDAGWRVK